MVRLASFAALVDLHDAVGAGTEVPFLQDNDEPRVLDLPRDPLRRTPMVRPAGGGTPFGGRVSAAPGPDRAVATMHVPVAVTGSPQQPPGSEPGVREPSTAS